MTKRKTGYLIASLPAGFLPVAYAFFAFSVFNSSLFGVDIRSVESSVLWWIGMIAIWLTFIQWPFYLLWVVMSRELSLKQKVTWVIVIFLGNMIAMPYFLWCKYWNTAASGLPLPGFHTNIESSRSAKIRRYIHTGMMLIIVLGMMFGLFYFAWQSLLWKNEALISAEFAAKGWASNDFAKGTLIQLRFTIAKEAQQAPNPAIVDGKYVIREWVGYVDPMFKDTNSPSIQVARKMVEVYNARMKELVENPEGTTRKLTEHQH
ncbi:MAG: hypothetical protein WC637_17850 [Victivallales bacterium]|jgi:hypothetical protein